MPPAAAAVKKIEIFLRQGFGIYGLVAAIHSYPALRIEGPERVFPPDKLKQ